MGTLPAFRLIGQTMASCLVTFAILFAITDRLGIICLPKLLVFVMSIALYLLCIFLVKPLFDDYRNSRMAKSLGAKLPPRIDLGLVEVLRKTIRMGYPGKFDDLYYRIKLKLALSISESREFL